MEEDIKLKKENELLLKEVLHLKGLQQSGKNKWIKIFIIVGIVMFMAGIWKSLITMFWFEKEVVLMTTQQIVFSSVGFVFVAANDSLAQFANSIGKYLVEKFK